MSGFFETTDIYLTDQESTFFHFSSFLTKLVPLKMCFCPVNKANLEHFLIKYHFKKTKNEKKACFVKY